jgi:hypothetical protein
MKKNGGVYFSCGIVGMMTTTTVMKLAHVCCWLIVCYVLAVRGAFWCEDTVCIVLGLGLLVFSRMLWSSSLDQQRSLLRTKTKKKGPFNTACDGGRGLQAPQRPSRGDAGGLRSLGSVLSWGSVTVIPVLYKGGRGMYSKGQKTNCTYIGTTTQATRPTLIYQWSLLHGNREAGGVVMWCLSPPPQCSKPGPLLNQYAVFGVRLFLRWCTYARLFCCFHVEIFTDCVQKKKKKRMKKITCK